METISFLNLLILFITLLVIVFYTIETRKLRIINNKIFELEKAKLKPNIVAYFDPNPKDFTIRFCLKNVGGGAAFSISLTFNPDFNFGDKQLEKYFNDRKVFNEGLSVLNPNEKFEMIVGFTTQASEFYEKGEIPYEYSIETNFMDSEGQLYNVKRTISVHQFFNRILDEHPVAKNLEKIHKDLEKMNDNLRTLLSNR